MTSQYVTGYVYQLAQEQARVYAEWHLTAGTSLQTAEDDVSALLDALEARLNASLESSDSLKSTLEELAAESDGEESESESERARKRERERERER